MRRASLLIVGRLVGARAHQSQKRANRFLILNDSRKFRLGAALISFALIGGSVVSGIYLSQNGTAADFARAFDVIARGGAQLHSDGGSYRSANEDVVIPATTARPMIVKIGSSTLSMKLMNSSSTVSATVVDGGQAIAYVDGAAATVVTARASGGLETTDVLRDVSAPTTSSWKVLLDGEERLRLQRGAVDVDRIPQGKDVSREQTIARFAKPSARDAAGHALTSWLTVSGAVVTTHLTVPRHAVFPVTVDPAVQAASGTSACPATVQASVYSNGQGGLTLGCQPWRAVGFNDYRLMDYAAPNAFVQSSTQNQGCGQIVDDEDQTWETQQIAATGSNVIRVWFYQKYYQDYLANNPSGSGWMPYIQLLQQAKAAGLRVIPVLVNEWNQCDREDGSLNDGNALSVNFYKSGYTSSQFGYQYSAKAWSAMVAREFSPNSPDAAAAGLWRQIAFYQVVNEAEADNPSSAASTPAADQGLMTKEDGSVACAPGGAAVLNAFAQDMGSTIKSAYVGSSGATAPLISFGSMGIGQCGVSSSVADPTGAANVDDFGEVYSANSIDICDVHDYDAEDQSDPSYQWYGIPENSLEQRIADCGTKPLVITEAGVEANVSAGDTQHHNADASPTPDSLQQRAQYVSDKLAAAFNDGVAGYVLWDKIMASSASTWNVANDQALGYGSYGSGTAQGAGSQDPALCVVKDFTASGSWSQGSPGPAANSACSHWDVPVPGPTNHYSFIDGTAEGWGKNQGWGDLGVAADTTQTHTGSGSGSLKITVAGNPTLDTSTTVAPGTPKFNPYSEIEVESASVALLTPGSTVTMWVNEGSNTCQGLSFKPVLRLNSGWDYSAGTSVQASIGSWTALQITVPSVDASTGAAVTAVNAVGLEVDVPSLTSSTWDTSCEGNSVYVDDVSW
ncbi:hypothetical protein [Curtobacterium sp. VKM Ac-2922]|uniref:hypothetical protein n=1 Tax=Curtobacterium sp. VKM Ac-2922 TaxID=2929475 RepID=UPI001FB4A469|nr:hypothetical protein [Curtobacterium sp. VKM Ac-2922]MCJ1715116.1 hypothetical protein [Curtobacterium sp. VKM Ac-2922]